MMEQSGQYAKLSHLKRMVPAVLCVQTNSKYVYNINALEFEGLYNIDAIMCLSQHYYVHKNHKNLT